MIYIQGNPLTNFVCKITAFLADECMGPTCTTPTVDMTPSVCTLLLCVLVNVALCYSECIQDDFCYYLDVEGNSTVLMEFPQHIGLVQQSCTYLCLKDHLCTAVTFDGKKDLCRLHLDQDENSCVSSLNAEGNILYVQKRWDFCPPEESMVRPLSNVI